MKSMLFTCITARAGVELVNHNLKTAAFKNMLFSVFCWGGGGRGKPQTKQVLFSNLLFSVFCLGG